MTLRILAISTFEQASLQRLADARQAVQDVTVPFDADLLEVFHHEETEGFALYVFGDGETFLSARDLGEGWQVDVVGEDDGWVRLAGPVVSLVQLGELLAGLPEPPSEPETPVYPGWFQRWSPDGWPEGAIVTHDGQLWRSTMPNNTWAPGVYGWEPYEGGV